MIAWSHRALFGTGKRYRRRGWGKREGGGWAGKYVFPTKSVFSLDFRDARVLGVKRRYGGRPKCSSRSATRAMFWGISASWASVMGAGHA